MGCHFTTHEQDPADRLFVDALELHAEAIDACDGRLIAVCQRAALGDPAALAELEALVRAGVIAARG